MKILVILPTLAAGGTTRIVMSVAQRLAANGWTITLATLFPEPNDPLNKIVAGVEHIALVPHGRKQPHKALLGVVRLARAHDIVMAAQEIAATNYGWLAGLLAHRPFISWTHVAYERLAPLLPPGHDAICRFIYRRLQHIIFPSQGALDSLARACRRRPPPGWRVIANFIEPLSNEGDWKSEWDVWFRKPVVLAVARLAPQKALDRLIRAHRNIIDRGITHHLVIAGAGRERSQLEIEVARLEVSETVFFAGHVERPAPLYTRATLFGMCSRYEGFGLTLLEAMAAGLPVVAMDCESGPHEVLDGGRAGVLTPDGDETAFANALAHLLTDDTAKRHYAAAGRARAEAYKIEHVMQQWEKLLLRIAAEVRTNPAIR